MSADVRVVCSVTADETNLISKCYVVAIQERFDEMPEPKFLYGSHYSSPAHVLFFLARAGTVTSAKEDMFSSVLVS